MPYLSAQIGSEEWVKFLLGGLQSASVVIASGARVVPVSGRSAHVPVSANVQPAWYAELDEIDEDGSAADEVELVPQKVAALAVASSEAIDDTSVPLDAVGTDLVTRVAGALDAGMLSGTGYGDNMPEGLLNIATIPTRPDLDVNYAGLVTAAGDVRAEGAMPDVAYVSPVDHTSLALAVDLANRPLLQSTESGPAEVVGGLRLWPSPAVPAGVALVGQAAMILVGMRQDATFSVSTDAAFGRDAVLIRAIARADVNVADPAAFTIVGTPTGS